MGGFCSRSAAVDKSPSESTLYSHVFRYHESMFDKRTLGDLMNPPLAEAMEKRLWEQSFSLSEKKTPASGNIRIDEIVPQEQCSSIKGKPSATAKVSEVTSLLGKAGTAGFGKAVEVLDTLGSSMTGLSLSGGFVSAATIKGNKISILAFEVANTIVKGANLMQSLSKENIEHLKEVVLPSEGIQNLVSKDMDELLMIAAADKREELKVVSREVIRFGNRCKDPQWHNLDRYFAKLGLEITPQKQLKEEAEGMLQQLLTLIQYTAELYHELHALDRFEQDYRQKQQEEENSNASERGDSLQILRQELKSQRKHVKSLKKKSLWSKSLEEVMEKLVGIVHFLNIEIHDAFGSADEDKLVKGINSHQRLGSSGLALHYASIINQIDTIASRSSSVPSNTRDTLYQGLPTTTKCALRFKLQSLELKDELTVPQIKTALEKTLQWIVPIANNTTKAHHGFGWVGEWANTGTEVNQKLAGQPDSTRIETLHHANKEKTEAYILDLVVLLHYLVSHSKPAGGGNKSPIKSPICSLRPTTLAISLARIKAGILPSALTKEDQEMLRDIDFRKTTPGISKSQEFDTGKLGMSKNIRLNKSTSHCAASGRKQFLPMMTRKRSMVPIIDFDADRTRTLDLIDRLDDIRS